MSEIDRTAYDIHMLGNFVDHLAEVPPALLLKDYERLSSVFTKLGNLLLRIGEIKIVQDKFLRAHQ